MTEVTFKRGPAENVLNLEKVNGQIVMTTDTGEMYMDLDNGKRVKITDIDFKNILNEAIGNGETLTDFTQLKTPIYSGFYKIRNSSNKFTIQILSLDDASLYTSTIKKGYNISSAIQFNNTSVVARANEVIYVESDDTTGTIQTILVVGIARFAGFSTKKNNTTDTRTWQSDATSLEIIANGKSIKLTSGSEDDFISTVNAPGNGTIIYNKYGSRLSCGDDYSQASDLILYDNEVRLQKKGLAPGVDTSLRICGVSTPTENNDAANKKYVDSKIGEAGEGIVDQTYSPTSSAAQSGIAVAQALNSLPIYQLDATQETVDCNNLTDEGIYFITGTPLNQPIETAIPGCIIAVMKNDTYINQIELTMGYKRICQANMWISWNTLFQTKGSNDLNTTNKTIVGAINELKALIDAIPVYSDGDGVSY